MRVLLVDDNEDFLEGVCAWLAGAGVDVVGTAHSGREAIVEVERLEPDLVLMDVAMPDLNGLEATRRIKAKPGAPPVVLWTFHESVAARSEAWGAGADGFVAKTKVIEDLMRVIRDLVPEAPQKTGDSELP